MPVILATVPFLMQAPALVAQAPAAKPAPLPTTVTGTVVDATTGQPVGGALVQQSGAVTSSFTQADGTFRLLVDPRGAKTLVISAVGFEQNTVAIAKNVRVELSPVAGFVPVVPIAPVVPLGTSEAETAPLNTGIQFGYRFGYHTLGSNGANTSGFINNNFRLGARLRWYPWIGEADGVHYETPVDVAGLPREENPAFRPSTWQLGARFGRIYALSADTETAGYIAYRYTNTVPNNAEIPYTGSNIDFEQTRHALGLAGTWAWRPHRGPWHYEASLGLYPAVYGWAKAPGAAFGNNFLTTLDATVGYEIVPGMRLGLGYHGQDWRGGNGYDSSHMLGVNVHYTPGGVPSPAAQRAETKNPKTQEPAK